MLLRAAFVTLSAALLVPLAAGTAQASCADDLNNNVYDGFYWDPKSPYWNLGYVQYSGTATVSVHGDALLSDYLSYATADAPRWVTVVSTNAPGAATTFVDCVAG